MSFNFGISINKIFLKRKPVQKIIFRNVIYRSPFHL